jgi:hypothetical protein
MRRIRGRLRVIRRAGRTLLAVREASSIFSLALGVVAGLILLDYGLRWPAGTRWVLLVGLAIGLVVAAWRRLVPVTWFRPPLVDVAHRVESWLAGRGVSPGGRLASGVGLRGGDDDDPLTRTLAGLAQAEAAGLLPSLPLGMLRWKRPAALLGVLAVLAVGSAVWINATPGLAVTGLTRLFMPWTDAAWPRLTAIVDRTPTGVHPADSPLPVRAVLTKSNREAGQARIVVRYRVIGADGTRGAEREAVLVPQPGGDADGEVYERLIEPAAWASGEGDGASGGGAPGERTVEYTIASEDDRTPARRVRVVDPPRLIGATVEIDPPAYATAMADGAWASGERGLALREASVGPILFGSAVRMTLRYSKAIEPSEASFPTGASVSADGETVSIDLSGEDSSGLTLHATDADGLRTREAFRARLTVVRDRAPGAVVIDPSADRAVLATAVVPIEGQATDDLGLVGARLEHRIASADPASPGGELVAGDRVEVFAAVDEPEGGATSLSVTGVLDLATLGVSPGQEVWVYAGAEDAFELEGERHGVVLSTPRRLRIIEESELIEIVQGELEGVRRNAISLDKRQGSVMEDAARAIERHAAGEIDDDGLERALDDAAVRQAEVSQRTRAQAAALRAIGERLAQNRVEDGAIRSLLEQAGQTASDAERAADRAAGQAAARAAGDEHADPAEAQDDVRESLERLIDQLDRGQDDWVVRRAIERLAETQRELAEQTARIGEQTVGRELGELTPDERTELERIADRQRELAQRAQEAIDDLSAKAEEMRESDPTQSAALDEAARAAMRQQIAEAMREAGAQVSENQTGEAGRMQQQTVEDLERMLEGLENARRMRDQALRRELASLMDAIRSLIRQQEGAIRALDEAPEEAGGLVERVRTNTLAAAAEARGGFEETADVAGLLDRAAGSQLEAIRALRAEPADLASARGAEEAALARLREALAEAEKQDEDAAQRERERQRRELLDAYRAVLEEQTALRARTGAIDPANMNRRDRAEARAIGRDQEALRLVIEGIPGEHELPDGSVISLYHTRIDGSLVSAVRRLGRGDLDAGVLGEQDAALSLLRAIVEILSPQDAPEEPFDDQQGGGGGGGGGGGQDQPAIGQLEELRLLRSLQAVVLEQTRAAGEAGDAGLAAIQREIAEQARRIIESMQGGGPNGPRMGPRGPENPADGGSGGGVEEQPADGADPEAGDNGTDEGGNG